MSSFETAANGKWILAGEHSVLRGVPALVFPLRSRGMTLSYLSNDRPLQLILDGEHGAELQPLFWAVLERACDLMRVPRAMMKGSLQIRSALPIGAGLGASAAFCAVMTRWFQNQKWLVSADPYDFARTLENLFHGESSGVDVAVAMTGQGLHFEREGQRFQVVPRWLPRWYISYSGQRGVTADAVRRVKEFIIKDPEMGFRWDAEMRLAVEECERSLQMESSSGFLLLCQGVRRARQCFDHWGLTEGVVTAHMAELESFGAVAVKPTGSGGGGYVLSVWDREPPKEILECLIPCDSETSLQS